ncbi:hypothetical protein DY000_02043611 [Brassica cretica]|uniref:Uncharacterized protein n=1 Tax=Brassica cretica TaxID=69181 RepID=A0ABQ7BI51_BRACR|nr:hypothetical protein DY000_02043611 [Brassica cretica]
MLKSYQENVRVYKPREARCQEKMLIRKVRRGLRDPRFGSPTVGKEERARRKAQRSLTSHRIENVEEDETLWKTRYDGTRVNTW